MLNEEDQEVLRGIFLTRMEECEGCKYYREWAERATWLDYEEEGRVMCRLLGGEGDDLKECQIIAKEEDDEYNE